MVIPLKSNGLASLIGFIEQGTIRQLHHECGFDVEGIVSTVKQLISE